MAFRTNAIQIDGSLNIDGSIYQWNQLFVGGGGGGGGNVSWASGNVGSDNQILTANGDGSIVAESTLLFSNNTLYARDNLGVTGPQPLIIKAGDQTSSGAGAPLTIKGGNAASNAAGGDVSIYGGVGAGGLNGGNLYIQSGHASGGNGGTLQILGGSSSGATGGGIRIIAGNAAGTGGSVSIKAGTSSGNGGDVSINAGDAGAGVAGRIFLGNNLQVDDVSLNYILPAGTNNFLDGLQLSKAGTRGKAGFYNSTTQTGYFLPMIDAIPDYNISNGGSLFIRVWEASTAASTAGMLTVRAQNYTGDGTVSNAKKALEIQNYTTNLFAVYGNGDVSIAGDLFVKGMDGATSSNVVYYQSDGELTYGSVPEADISTLSIESYVNSSTYYDASIAYRRFPEPSTGLGSADSQGMYCNFVAGATISAWYCCYIMTNGRVGLADADASNNMPCIAINTTGGSLSSGTTYSLLIYGPIRYTGYSFVPGKPIYVGTNGFPTTTAPTGVTDCVQVIGYAISNDAFIFNPSPDFIVLK